MSPAAAPAGARGWTWLRVRPEAVAGALLPSNLPLLFRVLGAYLDVRRRLRREGLRSVLRRLDRPPRRRGPADRADLQTIARFARLWIHKVFRDPHPCLPFALTCYGFCRRAGVPAVFRCGLRRRDGSREGHAWLTLDGRPFLESGAGLEDLVETFSFASEGAKVGPDGASAVTSSRAPGEGRGRPGRP